MTIKAKFGQESYHISQGGMAVAWHFDRVS